MLPHT